jgi:arylsulfatase A-like enzyme
MDAHVGQLLDAVDALGVRDDTIFVFTSDNGPDPTFPHQGSSGPWRGYYFTHMEGSSRTPFIIRWPGKIPAGRVSNEIVHEMDTFTTFAKLAGAPVPQDRPIDGVDQADFLLGKKETSNRDGILLFNADRLEAAKWRNWKLAFYDEEHNWFSPPLKLGTPKLFNLILDPKEEFPVTVENTWAVEPMTKMIGKFMGSLKTNPLIQPGTPDPFTPPK